MTDILIAVIFIISLCFGYKNGLMKHAYRLVSFLLSIALAYLLYPYIRDFIDGSGAGSAIREAVQVNYVNPRVENATLSVGELPDYMKSMVENGQLGLADGISAFISSLIINLIAFLAVFLLVRIIIAVVGAQIGIVSKLPIIRFFDKGLGAVVGLLEGILLVYVLLAALTVITPLRENQEIQTYISDSTLTREMYENNPIVMIVQPTNYDDLTNIN